MPFGQGFGQAFGGTGVVPVTSPAAPIGTALPMSFDFTTDPDGPLPGEWAFLVLSDDGFGNKSTTPEPKASAALLFRVVSGQAGWLYDRAPTIPGLHAPFDEHGALASPPGILQGRNGEVGVVFVAPPLMVDEEADSFTFEVLIGLRADATFTKFVGGRVRAAWSRVGGWTTPLALEAVSASGQVPVVIGSATMPTDINNVTDTWAASPKHELHVTLRGGELDVLLDGILAVSAAVPDATGSTPIILVRCFNQTGAGINPLSALLGISFQSLRDVERLGPPPQIIGDLDMENPPIPRIQLPVDDLVQKGILKRQGARTFVATQDVNIDNVIVLEAGDPVRAIEPFEGQLLTACVLDLAQIRALRRGGKNG